ncbi:hypothetical protein [Clostridium algidicarnis]|uniref:hypothetical protein n=1 Tax=Clostridium algidicarnis TaxID=37659 RepID=UPI001C0E189B|nr:hypothetical protein [Clostridium algidicarnis]MBU3204347.1 hypothetical protein [Clostridium algidicarnis]MBU3212569.1 hypothetical protein [Clostridium algidicarnis]MBU3223000.1 hypothetical protein [Clostridium algidicarnis]
MAKLFIKTESLVLTILMHVVSNSLALAYGIFEIQAIINTEIEIGFALIAIAIYYFSGKKYKLDKDIILLEKEDMIFPTDKSIQKKKDNSKIQLENIDPYRCFYRQTPIKLSLTMDIIIIIMSILPSIKFIP